MLFFSKKDSLLPSIYLLDQKLQMQCHFKIFISQTYDSQTSYNSGNSPHSHLNSYSYTQAHTKTYRKKKGKQIPTGFHMIKSGSLLLLTGIYGFKQRWIIVLLYVIVKQFSCFYPTNAHNFIWWNSLKASLKQSYKLPKRPMQYFPSLRTPRNPFL